MAPRIAILVNPASGRRRASVTGMRLVAALRARGAQVRVGVGRTAPDTVRLARDLVSDGPAALLAVGGDGMVHTALQAVVGTDVPLGVIAAGTGNDIARVLGLPRKTGAAADAVLGGRTTRVDTVRSGEQHFLSVMACGFDSLVAERVNDTSLRLGRLNYVAGTLAELRTFTPIPFTVDVDGTVLRAEGTLVAVGNTSTYGGGMRICPDADHTDGLAEVVFVHAVDRVRLLRFFPRVFTGTHIELDEVTVLRGRRISVSADTDVVAFADGERFSPLPLTCETVPGSVHVLR